MIGDMKLYRTLFIIIVCAAIMANLVRADSKVQRHIEKAKAYTASNRLNDAADELITAFTELCEGMYKIIGKYSPHSGMLFNPITCGKEVVQFRGRMSASTIALTAWGQNSLDCVKYPTIMFEQVKYHQDRRGDKFEFNSCNSLFRDVDGKEDRKAEMETKLTRFIIKTIERISLKECATWWNKNFCQLAIRLVKEYTRMFDTNPNGFTLTEAYNFLMTYSAYVRSDWGTSGQLKFSQEDIVPTKENAHSLVAHLILHPSVHPKVKKFILTALVNWNQPTCNVVGKVGGIKVYPLGFYQIEPDVLHKSVVPLASTYTTPEAIQNAQTVQKAQQEWFVAWQQTLARWKKEVDDILNPPPPPVSQPQSSGLKLKLKSVYNAGLNRWVDVLDFDYGQNP
jgi:hypothetical protein